MPEGMKPEYPKVLAYWVILLEAAILRNLRKSLAPFDISELQFIILDLCFREEANTVSSIAKTAHYDPSVVSRHVENLRSRGLVRTRRLKRDRRVMWVSLTDEALKLREQLYAAAIEADGSISRHLGPGEREVLLAIVRKLVLTLEEQAV